MPSDGENHLFTPCEAAEYCRISTSTLAKRRLAGLPPTFVKFGRSVRYERVELDRLRDSCRRRSTSEYS
jgi:hypothetical protein